MSAELFDLLSILALYVGTFVFILFFFEVGCQIGKYTRSHDESVNDTSPGPMVGGVLAMLAFVLAMTFSMAANRFEVRKQNVLDEVNSISTAYMRADFLAQPHRSEVKRLLREYVDIRLQGMEKNKRKTAVTRSLELHKLLWDQTTLAVSQNPTMLSVLIIQSINQVIDMHETRITAAERNRIPDSIWFALYAITAFSMITIGSQAGLMKMRRLTQVIPAMLAFSAIITLVADLDLPSEMGHIGVSQEAMVDLQKNMISPSQ